MKLLISEHDDFESRYVLKFKTEAQKYGLFVSYEKDRAAIDIGLHLTEKVEPNYRKPTQSRIWFQLKGKHKGTLPLRQYEESETIDLSISIEQLKFWYASPEAVYLAVYVESADVFVIEDVRDIVLRQWGERLFEEGTFKVDQESTTIKLRKINESCPEIWERMYFHNSIRIDGPSYKGRPLGHRLDPLRCIPEKFEPDDFENLVFRLLEVHGFREKEAIAPEVLFSNNYGQVKIMKGVLLQTYEWRSQLGTFFGFSDEVEHGLRGESKLESAQGKCLVVIHSNSVTEPNPDAIDRLSSKLLEEEIKNVLFFVNRDFSKNEFGLRSFSYLGNISRNFGKHGIDCSPQFLGDLAFNILIATNVYLEFRDIIRWKIINYLL
ncbi:MAG: hypothetical protein KAF91_07940 [Nostoc sp. TH1S01]|nr:hypothetical protein [Nostoc sp. TH1S01]